MKKRVAVIERKTKETQIRGRLNLDGEGKSSISTGIGFLDHMLELFAKHGLFDLQVKAKGDLHIDLHHTNEDLGLALGQAFHQALGEKRGIRRMGSAFVPMDETLARVRVVADVSGRPHFRLDWAPGRKRAEFRRGERISYGLEDAKHFLESFSARSGLTLHVDVLKAGGDAHHLLEAVFKALGRALREAVDRDPRVRGVPSTKGKL
ncbi:MAG: imidazoleglycerol-phosphate dehydratase HisB [Candidatus Omnitrophota bacterium]|nr:imidazoleglycerol-phosphate dehydratase HisB [Candidatus Omnitrophota bacterium]